jgi:hypothetical protein
MVEEIINPSLSMVYVQYWRPKSDSVPFEEGKKMRAIYFASLICLSLVILASVALAREEFIFQFGKDGYEGTKDTHVTEYPGNNANNMGGNIENECGEYNPANVDGKSVLVWFDVSSIPKSAVISSATLEMYMSTTRNGTNEKEVATHQLLKDWAEGTGVGIDGNGAQKDQVSGLWTGVGGEVWDKIGADKPGGDFVEKANDTIKIAGDVEWYSWDVTEMCQDWIRNPDKNFGAILLEPRPHAQTTGTKVFASKENPNADIHPRLVVEVKAMSVNSIGKLTTSWGMIKSDA